VVPRAARGAGVALDPARIVALRHGTYPDGSRWQEYWAPCPITATAFVLPEGRDHAWFALDDALALPDLADYTRGSLLACRASLAPRR
jgi:hypothetical protein